MPRKNLFKLAGLIFSAAAAVAAFSFNWGYCAEDILLTDNVGIGKTNPAYKLEVDPLAVFYNTRLVDLYMSAGNFAQVIKELAPKVESNPQDAVDADILLSAYLGAKMKNEAISLFEKRIAAEPDSAVLCGKYAQALADFGMSKEAAQQWHNASELEPQNPYFKDKEEEINKKLGKAGKAQKTNQGEKDA